ncbi:MAG: hypothetical protein ACYCPP_05295 [Nitrososphaerales archaeon]
MTESDVAILILVQTLAYLPHLGILTGILDILVGLIVLIIGILIIVLVIGALIIFLPAIIVAAVVWFLTGSLLLAGIAFLIVAVISIAVV